MTKEEIEELSDIISKNMLYHYREYFSFPITLEQQEEKNTKEDWNEIRDKLDKEYGPLYGTRRL